MSAFLNFIVKFLTGVVIYAGLPLVGWGVLDWQGFVAHPARLAYVFSVVLLQAIVVIIAPDIGRMGGAGKKTVRRQRVVVLLLQGLSLAVLFVAPYSDHWDIAAFTAFDVGRYLGLGVFVFGFILLNWAEASLGKQFSAQVAIQEGHRLVTEGLFRYLRHPRYLSIIVYNTGIALVYRSWLAFVLVAALLLVLLWRIHDEELLLHEEFGAEWESYVARSWRLFPSIY